MIKHPSYLIPAMLIACFLSLASTRSFADEAPSKITFQQIEAEIQTFLKQHFESQTSGRLSFKVSEFDKRFQFKSCSSNLRYSLPHETSLGQRTTVAVQCDHPQAWSLLIPVVASAYREVVISNRPLARFDLLSPSSLTMKEVNILTLGQGYFDKQSDLEGMEIIKPLPMGMVLTPSHVAFPKVIKSGDAVKITATTKRVSVITHGKAMEEGRLGSLIRVKNDSSQRVIQAVVTGPRSVQVH